MNNNLFLIQRKEHNGLIHHFLFDKLNNKISVKISNELIDYPMYSIEQDTDIIRQCISEYLEKLHYESPTDVLAGNRLQHICNMFRSPMYHAGRIRVDIPVTNEKNESCTLLHIIEQGSLFKDEKNYKPKYEAVLYYKDKNIIETTNVNNVHIDDIVFWKWFTRLPVVVLISFCFPNEWTEYVPKALNISYPLQKGVDITDAKEKKNTSHKKKTQKTEEQKLEKKWNDLRKWVESVPDFSTKSEKDKVNIVNSIMLKKYGKTINIDTDDLLF